MPCQHKHYTQTNVIPNDCVAVWYCLDCQQIIDKPVREKRREFWMGVGIGAITLVISLILILAAPFGFSERGEITSRWIPISLSTFLFSLPQSVYSMFGGLWPLIVIVMVKMFKVLNLRRRILFLSPCYLALGCQAITSDGTRVAISILLPFILIIACSLS